MFNCQIYCIASMNVVVKNVLCKYNHNWIETQKSGIALKDQCYFQLHKTIGLWTTVIICRITTFLSTTIALSWLIKQKINAASDKIMLTLCSHFNPLSVLVLCNPLEGELH